MDFREGLLTLIDQVEKMSDMAQRQSRNITLLTLVVQKQGEEIRLLKEKIQRIMEAKHE